ncbi:MAG: hypothetical protein ABI594_15505 [Ginsengibacter sp.]
MQSGIFLPGNAKALVKLRGADDHYLIAASQNRGPLELFKKKESQKNISLNPDDKIIFIHLKNGKVRREEVYHGDSFLSQSSSFISVNDTMKSIDIINDKNETRTINFKQELRLSGVAILNHSIFLYFSASSITKTQSCP